MIAWLTRVGLLLVAGAAFAAALGTASPWAWWFGLAVPAALLAVLATALAFEMAYARALNRSTLTAGPRPRTLFSAWWAELWATSSLVVWRMPFLSARQPASTTSACGQRGLVLVHGYACNRSIWTAWLTNLAARQIPCTAINLEPVFASISEYGPLIEAAVSRMQQQTGMAPVVVGHSMGGLAARAWWVQDRSASRLHHLITIATPHLGTVMATFGRGQAARQMRPRSSWLAQLQAQETPEHVQRTLCLYSDCDNVVIPSRSAILPGAASQEVFGSAHVAMVDHPDCFEAALRCVQQSD